MDKQEVYRMIKEQVKIVDYASRMGFTVIRKGRYFSLKEHDSVIIDPEKNCFWRNSKLGNGNSIGKGGSIIDFLLEFTDRSLHEVLKELSKEIFVEDMAKVPSFEKSKKMISRPTGTLELPPQDSHMHNVYAYLIQTRKIKKNIVQLFVDRKMLYQDTHKNYYRSLVVEYRKRVSQVTFKPSIAPTVSRGERRTDGTAVSRQLGNRTLQRDDNCRE